MANPYYDPTRFDPPLQLVAELSDWDRTTALWRRVGTLDFYTAVSYVSLDPVRLFGEFGRLADLSRLGLRSYPDRNLVTFRDLATRAEAADPYLDGAQRDEFIAAVSDAERQYGARNDLRTRPRAKLKK